MAGLRVLIVDDEPVARKVLRDELECLNQVTVVGEADNGESALLKITELMPDVVFLDVQMPGVDGFEMLNRLNGGHLPIVIMVTAFDQHAIRAFDAGAVDYLLKPVSPTRLQQSLDRARQLYRHPKVIAENIAHLQTVAKTGPTAGVAGTGSHTEAAEQPRLHKVIGRSGEEYFLLNPEEVLAFQAKGDKVSILTNKQSFWATQNLNSLEARLGNSQFRRIHRNALVNVNQIRKMSMITSQRWLITLNNGAEFIVSKRQARQLKDALPW